MTKVPITERCACGLPLHYTNTRQERLIRRMIAEYGADVKVSVDGQNFWWVPRHFVALHGISGQNLAELAHKYGFKRVETNEKN